MSSCRESGLQIDLHDSTVTNNTFKGDDVDSCLQLFGSQFGLVPSDHVTVSDNTFSHCNLYGIQLSPGIHHIYITRNQISSGFEGVNTRDVPRPGVSPGWKSTSTTTTLRTTQLRVRNGQMGILDANATGGCCQWPGRLAPERVITSATTSTTRHG